MFAKSHVRWFFASLLFIASSDLIAAEKFTELPPLDLSREERALARQYGKGDIAATDAAAKKAFQKQVDNDLRRLTQLREMARYGDIRNAIYNSYLAIYKPELKGARAEAISRIVMYAEGVSKSNNFSPQSRINFLALVSELDDQPRMRAAPPLPAAKAFRLLYEVSNDDKMPLYLRAVALHGLERQISVRWHAPGSAGWNDQQKTAVKTLLTTIIDSEPSNELDAKVHSWVVRRAYDCLAATSDPVAVDKAIDLLGNPDAPISARYTSANYLCQLDSSAMSDEQKQGYFVGLAHFVRISLVDWYEREDNLLKRASGATGGGEYGGGYGGGMGGMGGFGGGMGGMGGAGGGYGDMGGDSMGGGDYGGGYGGGYGDPGSGSSGNKKVKAIDNQDWQTILSRRRANQISQTARMCLAGVPVAESRFNGKVGTPLQDAGMSDELTSLVTDFTDSVDALQMAVNNVEAVSDVNDLLQGAEGPIEDIMDMVLEIPGFTDKYPDLHEGEGLEAVPDAPANEPTEGDAGAGGEAVGAGAPDGVGEPGVDGPNGEVSEPGGAN